MVNLLFGITIMLTLGGIKEIVSQLAWLHTLGDSDIKYCKTQIDELIQHLSSSLCSLWEATREITCLNDHDFNQKSFEAVRDYFFDFYLQPENIWQARTHCSDIKRDINRIKFKLERILRTDLGKWAEADQRFQQLIDADGTILRSYEVCLDTLKNSMDAIRDNLSRGHVDVAKNDYLSLKKELQNDIEEMHQGIKTMISASDYIRSIVG